MNATAISLAFGITLAGIGFSNEAAQPAPVQPIEAAQAHQVGNPVPLTDQERQGLMRFFVALELGQFEKMALHGVGQEPGDMFVIFRETDMSSTPPRFQEIMRQMLKIYFSLEGEDDMDKVMQLEKILKQDKDFDEMEEYMQEVSAMTLTRMNFGTFLKPWKQRIEQLDRNDPDDVPRIKAIIEEARKNADELIAAGQFPLYAAEPDLQEVGETDGNPKD